MFSKINFFIVLLIVYYIQEIHSVTVIHGEELSDGKYNVSH